MNELCTLNPELLDHINSVTNKAADPPRPAPDKASVTLPVLYCLQKEGQCAVSVRELNHFWNLNIYTVKSLTSWPNNPT